MRNDAEVLAARHAVPHLFGDLVVSVPVDAADTVSDMREILTTILEVHAEGANSDPLKQASREDWKAAIDAFLSHRPALALVDPEAVPYDGERGQCPTNWLVQAVPVSEQDTGLDLYMEMLSRAENGEAWTPDLAPASYLEDTCFVMNDGAVYSREEAANDDGRDSEDGDLMTLKALFEARQPKAA
ncbi:hypothetical protein GDI3917 (plasmid) [Gluconacetobacter diazotrophicus PA1 5]|uniref:Uncharacterized protein n=1 Tax=Gluconacetobacter diazotrophicus (strain ATCC 49037 / DSM 5601 / CCUG 37298 / CIP 103539 / LMG 7603 / PAl5) TaxID=272568 RepID=A9HT99_GLUDA|nr:hypothetical protein GDI3917 [Gluconacetobacter diazotrophicus PA1 5]